MLARVHTRQGCVTCPIGGDPPAALTIVATVGHKSMNRAEDVRAVQSGLNHVPAPMGGPAKALAVDGDCGAKTVAAIEAFQLKHFGWKDGVVTPSGPTLIKLSALLSAFGPQAVSEPDPSRAQTLRKRVQRAHQQMPVLRQVAMDAIATATAAVTFVDNGFLAHIDELGPRNAFRVADRYFAFGSQAAVVTRAELQFVLKMCRRVASAIAVRLGEIHGTPMGLPLFAADTTDAKFYAYTPRRSAPTTTAMGASSIYLCDLIDDEAPERYLRILCHEMFHFVDDETTEHEIVDHGPVGGALDLTHAQRMHNADNYALFAMHAHTGRAPPTF
ncbi:hypothetical protein HLB44_31080 [Aquincola sp. S2]|uniref:Peptidoglycan binding-like domain-containing protein n=1 Tax=Pseudaquabacterium terrae TaxID=2732868 RepID=A0ABX2ESM5_9BURK|nr:peptidoglycan-binding protein [Aquabacterium terrae]NRF71439.1 hypothetical protein [Aquabacterium terrae]